MNSLAQQKKEYTIQLYINQMSNVIVPIIYDGYKSIYDESFRLKPNEGIKTFGQFLRDMPNWSENIVNNEVNRINFEAKLGDYMFQLFNIIMMSIIMVMTATPNKLKSKITIPKSITFNKFIHAIYVHAAEKIFTNPYLFNIEGKEDEIIAKDRQLVHEYITKAIDSAITSLTPLTYILDNYMGLDTEILTEKRSERRQDTEVSDRNRQSQIQMSPYIDGIGEKTNVDDEIKVITESIKQIADKVSSEKAKVQSASARAIKVPIVHTKFNVTDIPESEAYFANKTKPLDVFNNTSYGKEVSENIKTDDIKKYAMQIDKVKVVHTTDDNSSVRKYVPSNKVTNVKV